MRERKMSVQASALLVALLHSDRPRYGYDLSHDELSFIDDTTITEMIDRMVRDGYVRRCDGTQNPTRPERRYVELTTLGRGRAIEARVYLTQLSTALARIGVQHSNRDAVD